MTFINGNQFWKLRSSSGRNPKFETAEQLATSIEEYFEVTSKRTWDQEDWVGKDAVPVTRKHPAPFTISGMCIFLDISQETLSNYRQKGGDFLDVITHAENIIKTQKFEGATVGFFNSNIIARDLGLKDERNINLNDTRKSTSELFPDDLEEDGEGKS